MEALDMPVPRKTTTAPAQDAGPGQTVNRNFALPIEQAEWLRETAFTTRVPQAQLVREALADLEKKYARRSKR
jgi:ribbon-helix-helix protein